MPNVSRRGLASLLAGAVSAPSLAPSLAKAAEGMTVNPDVLPVSVTDPQFGAKGDDAADDTRAIQAAIDFCYGPPEAPHGVKSTHLNKPLYFPPGRYRITAPLVLTKVTGAHIYGAGRFVTQIRQATPGQSIFVTNGCQFSTFNDFFGTGSPEGNATLFDLNWDGKKGQGALQSNTFMNIRMSVGGVGLGIALNNGFMGSENLVLNCFFDKMSIAGIKNGNWNALQNTIIGGNISHCGYGIWSTAGQFYLIASVGFQDQAKFDVRVDNTVGDGPTLIGCRTESLNFVQAENNPIKVTMIGCNQRNDTQGVFADIGSAHVTISECNSTAGVVRGISPRAKISQTTFGLARPFDVNFFNASSFLDIDSSYVGPEKVLIRRRSMVMHPVAGRGRVLQIDGGVPPVLAAPDGLKLDANMPGYFFSNEGAGQIAEFDLPVATDGLEFGFIVLNSKGLRINAADGNTIRLGAKVTGAGGHLESTEIGNLIQLRTLNGKEWIASSIVGETWSVN